jgi:predicted RNA-binding Zn ribbon-like protein
MLMLKASVFQAELLSGCLCLEMTNTVSMHASAQPGEWLNSYADLVAWARRVRIIEEQAAQVLLRTAEAQPEAAAQVVQRAIQVREAIYRICLALIAHVPPAPEDLSLLNAELARHAASPRITVAVDGFAWAWPLDETVLDGMLGPVVLSAAELLISDERERLGQCADDRGCGWLFLDVSRNRSRRWCSMEDCGNRAKQRRHHQRQSAQSPE